MRKLQHELKRMQELNKATDEEVSANYGDSTHVSLQAEATVPESHSKAGLSEHAGGQCPPLKTRVGVWSWTR